MLRKFVNCKYPDICSYEQNNRYISDTINDKSYLYYRIKDEAAATCSDVEGRRLGKWIDFINTAPSLAERSINHFCFFYVALAHLQTMIRPEQMVLKYAAIIGNTFSIEMLQSIIPPHINTSHLINTLNSLVSAGIIQCAFKKSSSEPCGCENKNRGKRL